MANPTQTTAAPERIKDAIVAEASELLAALTDPKRDGITKAGLSTLTATRFAKWIVERAAMQCAAPAGKLPEILYGPATKFPVITQNHKTKADPIIDMVVISHADYLRMDAPAGEVAALREAIKRIRKLTLDPSYAEYVTPHMGKGVGIQKTQYVVNSGEVQEICDEALATAPVTQPAYTRATADTDPLGIHGLAVTPAAEAEITYYRHPIFNRAALEILKAADYSIQQAMNGARLDIHAAMETIEKEKSDRRDAAPADVERLVTDIMQQERRCWQEPMPHPIYEQRHEDYCKRLIAFLAKREGK